MTETLLQSLNGSSEFNDENIMMRELSKTAANSHSNLEIKIAIATI